MVSNVVFFLLLLWDGVEVMLVEGKRIEDRELLIIYNLFGLLGWCGVVEGGVG